MKTKVSKIVEEERTFGAIRNQMMEVNDRAKGVETNPLLAPVFTLLSEERVERGRAAYIVSLGTASNSYSPDIRKAVLKKVKTAKEKMSFIRGDFRSKGLPTPKCLCEGKAHYPRLSQVRSHLGMDALSDDDSDG